VEGKDLKEVVERYLDLSRVAASLDLQSSEKLQGVANILYAWRIADHGSASVILHTSAAPGATPNDKQRAQYSKFYEAFIPITDTIEQPYLVLPTTDDHYAVLLRFTHAPYDSIVISLGRSDGAWKVVGLGWAVDH
jgi:hypothetical protein